MKILKSNHFDLILSTEDDINFNEPPVQNLTDLLFSKMSHRNESSNIVMSHDGNIPVIISLKRFRLITFTLFNQFKKKKINPGDTVLLASIAGNNELFIALMFTALTCYGIRVLLPMFMEIEELEEWLHLTGCHTIILPEQEIQSLNHHENEKSAVEGIKKIARKNQISCFDLLKDFNIQEQLNGQVPDINFSEQTLVKKAMQSTTIKTEAMMITTSGSSGKSKLVVYEQGGFIRSCMSWQKAGFFSKNKLGGRGFTPLFTHTMGVRAWFNALWTGVPVCLINTEWFAEKPEIVRYLLMQMRPAHITGGPSVYNLLLELMRNFPEIKNELRVHLRTVVSSGAPHSDHTAKTIETALGLTMYNAYGTTETQQALSTLLFDNPDDNDLKSLGLPLPGTSIGLEKLSDGQKLYRLYIKSPFGFKRILEIEKDIPTSKKTKKKPKGYFYTGDIVRLEDKINIVYEGRENKDFFKDGFGVKIPMNYMKNYYQKLYQKSTHIEYFTIRSIPGLAAMIFVNNPRKYDQKGIVADRNVIRFFACLIAEINTYLFKILEPFEFRHRLIRRFAIINSPPPTTVKGTISRYKIEKHFESLIDSLVEPLSSDPAVEDVEHKRILSDSFTQHLNPYVGYMLAGLGMDYSYHRAKKDTMYTYREGKELSILDFAGGYGTNLLGHNNEELKQELLSFIQNDSISISDQASIQKHAGTLAEELNLMVGEITGKNFAVVLGSSGAEAVEIAIHHAQLEWRKKMKKKEFQQYKLFGGNGKASELVRSVWRENKEIIRSAKVNIITLKQAFHGNTSNARALMGNEEKREPFKNIQGISTISIDDQSLHWKKDLKKALDHAFIQIKQVKRQNNIYQVEFVNVSTVIAAIIEPIVGEGGVREVSRNFLEYFSSQDFPLVLDEIQCGLGRSGSFLASKNINADYYLFGKSLGGNIEKISAVLINKHRYIDEFGKYYFSTFANGGRAAKIASKVLSIIKRDNLILVASKQGKILSEKLKQLKKRYPSVIAEITGKGLIQGIRFCDLSSSSHILLRILDTHKHLGYVFSAYLLKKHQIRIFPTLSAPNVLRIEPSAYVNDKEINHFVGAVSDLVDKIHKRKMYDLFLPLMEGDPFKDNKNQPPKPGLLHSVLDKPSRSAKKVAFIAHFVYPTEELRMFEKEFKQASDTGLRLLFNRFQLLMQLKPFLLFSKNLFSGQIHFSFIVLPVDSAELERLHRQRKSSKILEKIQEAVNMAAKSGAEIISLGGYTSILSNNGLSLLRPRNTKIITGNTLTAATGIKRLLEEIENREPFKKRNTIAIIGAAGNIGSIITEQMIKQSTLLNKIILINRNHQKLEKLVNDLNGKKNNNGIKITLSTDFSHLKECDIITVATNSNEPIIHPHHINPEKSVLISDVSVPSAVSSDVMKMKNVLTVPFASYISLPQNPEFIISSYTPRGTTFCCAAEAILCGLEPVNIPLNGKITTDGIELIKAQAEKYHFWNQMGTVKSFKTEVN